MVSKGKGGHSKYAGNFCVLKRKKKKVKKKEKEIDKEEEYKSKIAKIEAKRNKIIKNSKVYLENLFNNPPYIYYTPKSLAD